VVEARPGAPAVPPQPDDRHYPLPRPRPPLSVAALWTIGEGRAVTLWPGSHRWPEGQAPTGPGVRLPLAEGSCAILLGTLWHGQAPLPADTALTSRGTEITPAGRTTTPLGTAITPVGRMVTPLTVTAHYCEPWLRTREAFTLSPGRDVAREVSIRIRRMLGYSVYAPDTGLVDGVHPERVLA
jgi:ectoine hydroxylase-related dioxygenase (phytanoyl-CoA dioxygenase family)